VTRSRVLAGVAAFVCLAPALRAATFIVPPDRMLIDNAKAIVIASALASHAEPTDEGGIRTITSFSIQTVLKGSILEKTIDVEEPGGSLGDRAQRIEGVPQFTDGDSYVLFLASFDDRWHVMDLVLGKFSFQTDENGHDLLVRDTNAIIGWDADGSPHFELHRDQAMFLRYIIDIVAGRSADGRYYTELQSPVMTPPPRSGDMPKSPARLTPAPLAAFSASSYTMIVSGSLGSRWNIFPAPVTFFSIGTEPGAPGGGATAITTAMASWNGDPNSNVNYVYGGQDVSGLHTKGLSGSDGESTVMFERNLTAYGAGPFSCSGNSYGGTLGLGGVTNASGTHSGPGGEGFLTTLEGDVEMNQGIANCTVLFNNGDFNSAVTHELGHTLGFRHSDQTRADDPSVACTSVAGLECSSAAIMKASIPTGYNGALQAWDQHAVAAVYPGGGAIAPAAPTGVNARAQSSSNVVITWNGATGATSYTIRRRNPNGTFTEFTSTSLSYTDTTASPNTSYRYYVRAVNAVGTSADSAPDLATTVIFTDDPLVAGSTRIKAVHLAELRTAVNAVRAQAGLAAASFTDPATRGVVVKAVHITELRSALEAAMSSMGFGTATYTDPTLTPRSTRVRAVHFQELRNRVK
jgi:hypothetical protein